GGAAARSRITMVRRFVRSSEVHGVCSALGTIMGSPNLSNLELKTAGPRTESSSGSRVTAVLLEPSEGLRRLEERMVDALHIFAENPAEAKEYIVTPDHSPMDHDAIAAIYNFVPDRSGVSFRPQILVAPAQADAAAGAVVVKAVGLSVYQVRRPATAAW